jgi:hypothetical protein
MLAVMLWSAVGCMLFDSVSVVGDGLTWLEKEKHLAWR